MGHDLAVMKAEAAAFRLDLAWLRAEVVGDVSPADIAELRDDRHEAMFEVIAALRRRREARER